MNNCPRLTALPCHTGLTAPGPRARYPAAAVLKAARSQDFISSDGPSLLKQEQRWDIAAIGQRQRWDIAAIASHNAVPGSAGGGHVSAISGCAGRAPRPITLSG